MNFVFFFGELSVDVCEVMRLLYLACIGSGNRLVVFDESELLLCL